MWCYGSVIDWGFLGPGPCLCAALLQQRLGWGLRGTEAPEDRADGAGQQCCERMTGAEALPDHVSAFCQQQWWRKLLQLSLKSLCHIVKTLSASQPIWSHLYQLPVLAPNFCLSIWYQFLLLSLSPSVLKWTRDEGNGNIFPAASTASRWCDPYTDRHPQPWALKSPPLAQLVMIPSKEVGLVREVPQKFCCHGVPL